MHSDLVWYCLFSFSFWFSCQARRHWKVMNQQISKGLYEQVLLLFKGLLSSRKVLAHNYQDGIDLCACT